MRLRSAVGGVVVAAALAGCATPTTATGNGPPTPLPRQPGCAAAKITSSVCIVVLGDSIAVGVPVEGDDRWWPRLRHLLGADLPGRTVEVDNWAVSGSQVDVLEAAARDQPELATYDIAIVVEGVNDVAVRSAEQWKPRYEGAISAMEAKGLKVIVTAPPPEFLHGAFGTRYDAVAGSVRAVATAGRRSLLDLASRWRADGPRVAASYYVDSIHQALPGQIVMAELAVDAVREQIAP